MTFLQNLLHDLVEKRLWPVAAVLAIGVVAVPVVISGGSSDATPVPAPATSVASAGQTASGSLVTLDQTTITRDRRNTARNPFTQQHMPIVKTILTGGGSTSGATDTTTGTGGATPTTGGTTGDTTPPVTTPMPTPPKTNSEDTFRVSLRFGEAGNQRTIKDIARLTPLPSSTDPFFVFLGVLTDGKTAVFLVSSDAAPTGDGKCQPSTDSCETIQLKAGDTEFFDLSTGTAGVVQYQLDLLSVSKRKAASKSAASANHARESKVGRSILRAAVAQNDPGYRYMERFGVLEPNDLKTSVEAHVPAGALGGTADTRSAPPSEGAALPPAQPLDSSSP